MLYGGRWNPVGTGVIYSSSNPSLAALEILTQYEVLPTDFVLTEIEIPESIGLRIVGDQQLPSDWQSPPPVRMAEQIPISEAQSLGLLWTQQQNSGVLSVPSAVMGTDWPTERNYVINPQHPGYASIKFGAPKPFRFDPRLKSL